MKGAPVSQAQYLVVDLWSGAMFESATYPTVPAAVVANTYLGAPFMGFQT